MRFRDIPQFTKAAPYQTDIGWSYLPKFFEQEVAELHLDVNPDFQRGYVWTPEQKTRYVEFVLRGGTSGLDIYTNHIHWNHLNKAQPGDYVLVDGKQRLEAVLGFLANKVPVFGGHYCEEFEDRPQIVQARFHWHVNDLATREEVLQWYLDLNSGGTVHSEEELARVRQLKEELSKTRQPEETKKKKTHARKPT